LTAVLGSELLLVLSFARLWGDANSAIFTYLSVVDATLRQPIWGTALASRIGAFVGALLLVHLLLGVAAWCLGQLSRRAWPQSGNSTKVWSLFWLVCLALWVLAANAAWFPSSSLGSPYAGMLQASLLGVSVFDCMTIALGASLVLTLARAARDTWRIARRRAQWTLSALALGASAAAFASFGVSSSAPGGDRDRPHVIVIGVDSLRPDALHAEDGSVALPAIDDFLADSVVFSDAMTPLARTFPAWVSIVSGKHPHTTGAVINLLTRESIDEGDTLPRLLSRAGYHTVYATDEVRFSNLDVSYGFDEMLAPPMGAADFLLGFFGDTPLANLVVNTRAGAWLFPYGYANRAASITYDPDTFIERLRSRLDFDEPTFLAVHLTLTHWPYTWASTPLETRRSEKAVTAQLYHRAAARVDRQFRDLVATLRERGGLDDAIVVVLSDHGESLGEPASLADDEIAAHHIQWLKASGGHGTSVFAEPQYRVLLAMRSFDAEELPTAPGTRLDVPATLEDVAPTIAAALELTPESPFEGVSWLPALTGNADGRDDDRIRFTETEFVPTGLSSGMTFSPNALSDAADYYRVDPETDRVLIRAERLDELLRNRQYAALRGERMLAAVPSADLLQQHLVYLERRGAPAIWLTRAPEPADAGYDLWSALTQRFELVRERPVAPPHGSPN
jgi:hypothetical protein